MSARNRATSPVLRFEAEAWALLDGARVDYGRTCRPLIDYLLAPPGFWGHSAGDAADDEVRDG